MMSAGGDVAVLKASKVPRLQTLDMPMSSARTTILRLPPLAADVCAAANGSAAEIAPAPRSWMSVLLLVVMLVFIKLSFPFILPHRQGRGVQAFEVYTS